MYDTPQPDFPGDTVVNPEEDFWAPWQDGAQPVPGERGEFTDIPKQSPFGVPIPSGSGASPNRDDTERKEELPPVYNPDRTYGVHLAGEIYPGELYFYNTTTDYYKGQTNGTLLCYDKASYKPDPETGDYDGDLIGQIQWQLYSDVLHIAWVEVADQSRRKGIAIQMLEYLVKDMPGYPIDWGMTTRDGTALKAAWEARQSETAPSTYRTDREYGLHIDEGIQWISPRRIYFIDDDIDGFIKAAGTREEYLASLNAQPDVIQFVLSQPEETQKWYINEVRKNPTITLQQLQQLQAPKKEPPYTETELNTAALFSDFPALEKWFLVELKKHRFKDITNTYYYFQEKPGTSKVYSYKFPETGDMEDYGAITFGHTTCELIRDWYRATNPEIASYNFQQAWDAQRQWHEEFRDNGGKQYTEHNVTVDLGTIDPQLQGWTLQQVRTRGDLDAEGDNMGHCVGSYADEVEQGNSFIYSLRDPKNEPHVTIEATGDITTATPENPVTIVQIQGKENASPIVKYREMLKKIFTQFSKGSLLSEKKHYTTSLWGDLTEEEYVPLEDDQKFARVIKKLYDQETLDNYGLLSKTSLRPSLLVDDYETTFEFFTTSHSNTYPALDAQIQEAAKVFVQNAIAEDRKRFTAEALLPMLGVETGYAWDELTQNILFRKGSFIMALRSRARQVSQKGSRIGTLMGMVVESTLKEFANSLMYEVS